MLQRPALTGWAVLYWELSFSFSTLFPVDAGSAAVTSGWACFGLVLAWPARGWHFPGVHCRRFVVLLLNIENISALFLWHISDRSHDCGVVLGDTHLELVRTRRLAQRA